jgi:hypothetical protein
MTRIVVSKFGDVREEQIKSILDNMNETYERMRPREVELVDAFVFENSSLFRDFLSGEKMRLGVFDNFDSDFPAIHDAWRGIPRISFCMDKLNHLNDLVATGTVRHEVGHSVLHGSLEYYIFQTPPALSRVEEKHRLAPEYTRNILYLIAIAVKDYEVTDLLYSHGYQDDQVAYAQSLLEPSSNDLLAWQMAKGHPLAEVICIAGRMKDLLCAAPIIRSPNVSGEKLNKKAKSGLFYLPPELAKKVIEVAWQASEPAKASTHLKVEIASKILCDELFDQILGRT